MEPEVKVISQPSEIKESTEESEEEYILVRKPKTKEVKQETHGSQVEITTPTYGIVVASHNLRACCKNAQRFAQYYENKEKLKINNSLRSVQ